MKQRVINFTYIMAVALVLAWALGFLVFKAGNAIHILLVLAMMTVLVTIIREG